MENTQNQNSEEIIEFFIMKIHKMIGPITRSTLFKTLFILTRKLDDDNELKKILPFYWYYKGPISDRIYDVYFKMESEKKIRRGSPGENADIYYCDAEPANLDMKYTSELKILKGILDKYYDKNTNNSTDMIELCYRKYAPFKFMPYFNLDFRNGYNDLYATLLHDEDTNKWNGHLNRTLYLLNICQDHLVRKEEFTQFNNYFNLFVRCFKQAFTSDEFQRNEKNRKQFATHTKDLRDSIWESFENTLRCLEEGRDPGYESEIESWRGYSNEKLLLLVQQINFYYDCVTKYFGWGVTTESFLKDTILKSNKNHIPLIDLEYMATNEYPSRDYSKEKEHLATGCFLCNKNFKDFKKAAEIAKEEEAIVQ